MAEYYYWFIYPFGEFLLTKRMIFHAPYEIPETANSASRLRPRIMRETFARLGYEVFDLSGDVSRRRILKKQLRRSLKRGVKYDFLYFENSTQPNLFADSLKKGIAPFLDHSIHRMCKSYGIPVGVFYRDMYWRFRKDLHNSITFWNRVTDLVQRLDWFIYRRNRVQIFLPSKAMGAYLDLKGFKPVQELPPGAEIIDSPVVDKCNIFYVGGIGSHYRLHKVCEAVRGSGAHVRLCVRQKDWEQVKGEYKLEEAGNIEIVHAEKDQLDSQYEWAGIGLLALEPEKYLTFAVPFKFFEYIGRGKPVLASAGTYVAQLVARTGAGWVVPYDKEAIGDLLNHLVENPSEIAEKAAVTRQAAKSQTWQSRAQTVADALTSLQ